jgi:type I restriction enzyme M protein
VTNVGFDATGRERTGSQLARAASDLRGAISTRSARGMARIVRVPNRRRLSELASASSRTGDSRWTRRLGDLLVSARTGRTPPRSRYTESGVFALKVGNLTGHGIDWSPRVRNFVDEAFVSPALLLREGDIVLTSSAHNPTYIAQKVDIVTTIPDFVGGTATFVGEVMRLRVEESAIDPYELLAILRSPATRSALQALIRGQTAHLRPKDLLELGLPARPSSSALVELIREEARLAVRLNEVMEDQRRMLSSR